MYLLLTSNENENEITCVHVSHIKIKNKTIQNVNVCTTHHPTITHGSIKISRSNSSSVPTFLPWSLVYCLGDCFFWSTMLPFFLVFVFEAGLDDS